jgi:hypothetical protein
VSGLQQRATLRFGVPAGQTGWHGCARLLAEPARFDQWREDLAGWLTDQYGEAPEADHRRLRHVLVHVRAGLPRGPAVPPRAPGALAAPGRPGVSAGGAATAPGGDRGTQSGLRLPAERPGRRHRARHGGAGRACACRVLRGRYVAHAARFVAAFEPTVRFGRRTLWAAATDALDSSLWFAGRYGGDEGAGVLDASLVLPEPMAPFTSASTVRPVFDGHPHPRWTRRRESCCFHYLLQNGQGLCETCPRLCARGD